MKSSRVPLKQSHSCDLDAEESWACVLWDWHAKKLVTAAAEPQILIHSYPLNSTENPISLSHHKSPVTAIALNPHLKSLASASVDHCVKLYSYPEGEFQNNVTRFSLPIRSLAFNRPGQVLAAAGDDDGIKLISTIDNSIARVLKSHDASVISLDFDPENEFLASLDSEGTVIFWELATGKAVHKLKKVAPGRESDVGLLNALGWSPDGEMLAVPGRKGDVVMYDRDSAEKVCGLKGGHSDTVLGISWSPNGKYIATCGSDGEVLIWEFAKRQDLGRQRFESPIWSLSWKPTENALAVIDVMGRVGVWENPVPEHMVSPSEGAVVGFGSGIEDEDEGVFMGKYREEEQSLRDEMEEGAASAQGSLDGLGESSEDEMCKMPRRMSRHHRNDKTGMAVSDKAERNANAKEDDQKQVMSRNVLKHKYAIMQEPFQPGSTPRQQGKRSFLTYNLVGCAITLENEGSSHVEVEFHDTSTGTRMPTMSDYFGFTMASLNETGVVFASPQKGENNPSVLMYKPFSSWANNSEWSMRFPLGEEVRAVALGSGWVAALTSLNFLRIFSEGGLQRLVFSLDGPVVAAAGHEDLLFVAWHSSTPLPSGEQVLSFAVFNISKTSRTLSGRLPLSPHSQLSWMGFSEEGLLSTYDSAGTLRIFTNEYGGCWVPLLSAHTLGEKKSETENYWMVGLNSTQAFCVVCKSPETYPQVAPKPILTVLDLKLPLACSDVGADDLENEYITGSLLLSQLQKKVEDPVAAGKDCSADEGRIVKMERSLDGYLLRLIANCCKGDKLVRAIELANMLSFNSSLRAAIKLASTTKLPILAERLNAILEEKMLQDDMEVLASISSMSKMEHRMDSAELPISRAPVAKANTNHKSSFPSSHVNSDSVPLKKSSDPSSNMNSEDVVSVHETRPDLRMAENPEKKSQAKTCSPPETAKEKSQTSDIQSRPGSHKPSNPFAKAASGQQNGGSLLNSIKQMQSNPPENQGKRKEISPGSGKLAQRPPKQTKKAT